MSTKRNHETENSNNANKKPKFWALGLLDAMKDPALQVLEDDLIVVIKDKYPKAKYHYLVLPKEEISNLQKLNADHVDLLKHMIKTGHQLTKDDEHKKHKFMYGFHAAASMDRLHLHIISEDMNSPCLKTKKHWNTFTSAFFMNPKVILKDLKEHNLVKLPSPEEIKEFINTPLKCHKCDFKPKHLPDLKNHVTTHFE